MLDRPALEESLGQKLRSRRTQLGKGLREVSEATSISVGLISEIERGLSSPTVRNLIRLCDALEMTVSSLMAGTDLPASEDAPHILRLGERTVMKFEGRGMSKELMTRPGTPGMQAMMVNIEPDCGSGSEAYSHGGEEWGVVMQGHMEIEIDTVLHSLGPGDCFRFSSGLPHRFYNPGPGLAQVVWVVSEPLY